MFFENLAIARDWAVILLALEAFALSLVTLFICYLIARGLWRLFPRAVLALHRASEGLARVQGFVERAMVAVAAPFYVIAGMSSRVESFFRSVRWVLSRGR